MEENDDQADDCAAQDVCYPQVTSSDPDERKLARQLRISKRNEATRRLTRTGRGGEGLSHAGDIADEEALQKTELEKQVEQSAEELERLLLEGRELVTNVQVASDTREVKRRAEEVEKHKQRLERLEEEENTTRDLFDEVSRKWEMIADNSDPMDLKLEIDAQKEKCSELLHHKNAVIRDLMAELEAADLRFVKDQQCQLKEVSLLVQRIENQVKVMREAYRRELQLIEDAVNDERRELLDSCSKHWESLHNQRDKEEVNMLNLRFQEQKEQEQEVKRIRTKHRERYRQTKIKLENDIQLMQHEMEQVKALCLLNSEKLDYNYQVLQKREDENLMMRAQQKRRINKLQDMANNLRRKMRESEAAADQETARLRDEISRFQRNIADVERKADHFADVNDNRYHHVWNLHQASADKLVSRIMTIDRLIHEQQLGLKWTAPDIVPLDKSDLPSFHTAMQLVNQLFDSKAESKTDNSVSTGTKVRDDAAEGTSDKAHSTTEQLDKEELALLKHSAKQRLLKLILQRVADSAGFLVEERLRELLAPYSHPQRTIVQLDNVFNALGLRYEADIEMLKDFFLPYAVCTVCSKQEQPVLQPISGTDEDSQKILEIFHLEEQSEVLSSVATENMDPSTENNLITRKDEQVEEPQKGTSERTVGFLTSCAVTMLPQKPTPPEETCRELHPLEIHPVYVLQALRNFVTKFQENELADLKSIAFILARKRNTVSRLLTVEDVTKFWKHYQKVFPKKREQLWDGFLIALNKYHNILMERHKLNNEAKALKKQNAELRRLLNSYVTANASRQHSPVQNGLNTLPPLVTHNN